MVSEIDVCSILNIKENECVEKQKVNIEMIQHIAKSKKTKKSKRLKDEEYTKNKNGRKQPTPIPKKIGSHGKINRTLTFHGKPLCKIVFRVAILSAILEFVTNCCQFSTADVGCHCKQFSKKRKSLH